MYRSQKHILTEQCLGRHWSDSFSPIRTPTTPKPARLPRKDPGKCSTSKPKPNDRTAWGGGGSMLPHYCHTAPSHSLTVLFAGKHCPDKCMFLNPIKSLFFLSAKHSYSTEVIKYFILHNLRAGADISALLQCTERVLPLKYSQSYCEICSMGTANACTWDNSLTPTVTGSQVRKGTCSAATQK